MTNENVPLILVIHADASLCATIANQLNDLGYRTKVLHDFAHLQETIKITQPKASIIDLALYNNAPNNDQTIKFLHEVACQIIFISDQDTLQVRLNAVRNGGKAFLCKNYNFMELRNILDIVAPIQKDSKNKVLIIDDDKISSEYCKSILEHAGILVLCLHKLENIFAEIMNFNPDVILLDMYMPNIDGVEMASIIRQNQNTSTIPIVIMSGETDINKQFKTRSAGADDFILKPFKPNHLVDTIVNRIQRAKQTRYLIYTDGLTGLMIFSKIREQIGNLLESCLRYNLDFSLATLDIDLFKNVNDTYGHLIGDQVLRDFAEFLVTRVRRSDIVTRSGGEEFTIVFPYTSKENALNAINSIRQEYAKHVHNANNQEFTITFSAGIANSHNYNTLETLFAAADKALYTAKHNGRNNAQIAT